MLNSKLSRQIFLPANQTLELRRKYAYNMFDRSPLTTTTTTTKSKCDDHQHKNEEFFKDYRYYDELINLRHKWTFLQGALTTVYFPGRKDFSLDKIITFLEYRHVSFFRVDIASLNRQYLGSRLGKLSRTFINERGISK